MGYTEQVCQICGISFNIGRIRKHDEPWSAAWESFHGDFITLEDCGCEAEGCSNIARQPETLTVDSDGDNDEKAASDTLEHLAGPACTSRVGYSGWRITVEEMQDRLQCQCLAAKSDDWQPESEDEEFEIKAKYCWLTGISKEPASDFEVEGFQPVRHGLAESDIDNGSQESKPVDEKWALPMHPHCFVMFKRMSQTQRCKVDIDGLWRLRETQGNFENRFDNFPKRPDVDAVVQQWYDCIVGTEYLASDPLHIPDLDELLQSCELAAGTANETVFEHRDSASDRNDTFAQLSPELRHMLLMYLNLSDVANLRLSSRSFSQLPQAYFHALISKDMPWVWEVQSIKGKSMDWYRLWLKLSAADGGSGMDEKERQWQVDVRLQKSTALREQLQEEGFKMPSLEFSKQWGQRSARNDEGADAEIKAGYETGMWPARKTGELRGLRNRRRIWADLEEIIKRIAELPPDEEA